MLLDTNEDCHWANVENDAYYTPSATGYERVYVQIKPDDQVIFPALRYFQHEIFEDCVTVDLRYCQRLDTDNRLRRIIYGAS